MIESWRHGPKIEGGVDAIVLGATPDALAAAATLARSGLHVVQIDTGPGRLREKREFAPGYFAVDGDPIAYSLDADVIESLDLYRHGLSYIRRRLETFVRFSDGAALVLPGDPAQAAEAIAEMSEADAAVFSQYFETEQKTARALAEWFAGGRPPAALKGPLAESASASFDGAVVGRFADARIEDYLRAEAALGASARPSEPYTYFALLRRWAGEAAGLPCGLAAIEGGGRGLAHALRRAGQVHGVGLRQTDRVTKVIIEWDRVAGVAFDDGGQIRTPIIVSALPARETFLTLVGRDRLDIEFAQALDYVEPPVASVRVHLAVNGQIADSRAALKLDRRFLYAPSTFELDAAWRAAADGAAAGGAIGELLFPSALDPSLAPLGCATATALIHPAASRPPSDGVWRTKIEQAAQDLFVRLAPGSAAQIIAIDIESAEPAAPPVLAAIDRRRRLTDASGLEGYFFCGPESLIGGGAALSAGRRAAARALAYFREGSFGG
jgi:phytoene dehydrogenase-like protein